MKKTPKGAELDEKLSDLLEQKLNEGYLKSPISRVVLMKELNLSSRGTLGLPHRASMIENARLLQLENEGLKKPQNRGLKEQNTILRREINFVRTQHADLIELLIIITNRVQQHGLDINDIIEPIMNMKKSQTSD